MKWEKADIFTKEKYMEQFYAYKNYTPGPDSVHDTHKNIDEVLKFIHNVRPDNCKKYVHLLLSLLRGVSVQLEDGPMVKCHILQRTIFSFCG